MSLIQTVQKYLLNQKNLHLWSLKMPSIIQACSIDNEMMSSNILHDVTTPMET